MKENACCFTGHRTLPSNQIENIIIKLDLEIENLISKGVTNFISGGALGFDQIAASLVAAKKEQGRNILLTLALPCKNQDILWSKKQRYIYRGLLAEANKIIYVSENYDAFCMKRRNCYMVDHSAYCICAFSQEKSGTGQTIRYACKKGLSIINVAT